MKRKKNRHAGGAEKDNSERWLLTYSDLITLLMIFFVVLYAMSKVDSDKFKALADSLSKALGGGTPAKIEINTKISGRSIFISGKPNNYSERGRQNEPTKSYNDFTATQTGNKGDYAAEKEKMTILGIKEKIDKFAKDNGLQTKITGIIEERGLVVSIQDTLLFESGSAEITPYAKQVLEKVSVVLATIPNYIRVEGHTDNVPIHTPKFPSNWELSVARATNVVQLLITEGKINPLRLSAAGYGEFRPIADNQTQEGRAKNRRVDLVILKSMYDVTEPGSVEHGK